MNVLSCKPESLPNYGDLEFWLSTIHLPKLIGSEILHELVAFTSRGMNPGW